MEKLTIDFKAFAAFLLLAAAVGLTSCTSDGSNSSNQQTDHGNLQAKVDSLEAELEKYREEKALTEMRLARFDSLDYEFYSNQDWENFKISHADNIKVYYPDGKVTTGLYPEHIDMLTPMFVFAPDTKIKEHPIKFGSGDWTCVVGEMEGTFSKPMPMGNGKTIPPTDKKFKLRMATVARWEDGKITEEHLFWDNQAFMKQMGLAQ